MIGKRCTSDTKMLYIRHKAIGSECDLGCITFAQIVFPCHCLADEDLIVCKVVGDIRYSPEEFITAVLPAVYRN